MPIIKMQPIPLLTRLRTETHDAHQAIEQTLALPEYGLTLAGYRRRIGRFYGFYKPVEARLTAGNSVAEWLDMAERWKTPLLQDDVRVLGLETAQALPLCTDLPLLDSPAQRFGCLYVLEGATLGGVIISRQIRAALDITPQSGGKFFDGYGERTGERWHSFRAALTAFDAASGHPDLVIAAALATFETLRQWCEEK